MPIPPSPVAPSHDAYEALLAYWLAHGRPGAMENLAEGWLYRAYFPEPGSEGPVFVLVCSSPNLARALGTTQNSWRGRKSLPIEEI
jgi:hypothetical protein